MNSGRDIKQQENQQLHLHKSRISLAALSQHRGISVSTGFTSNVDKPQPSFNSLHLNQFHRQHYDDDVRQTAFASPEPNDANNATGRELYAPTNSILQVKLSSVAIEPRESSIDSFHSSVVSPSVFHIIPELQRGHSSYHIDHRESLSGTTSGWYTNFGDIDYLWSVIPSADTVTESVKAAVLDTYTDSSLPTILQPRFKAKAPGTSLALWVPNIMASLAKRFNEESSPGDFSSAGDRSKDIVKQNIGLLLKKDFISTNWPFKGTLTRQSDGSSLSDQQQRHRKKIDNHRAKVKHLRGEDSTDGLEHNHLAKKDSEHTTTKMEKSSTWRGWRKSRIKYIDKEHKTDTKSNDGVELEKYDSTPVTRRKRLGKSQDFGSVDSGRSSAELADYDSPVFTDDVVESMVYFNYSNDGLSYTCTLSPLQSVTTTDSVQMVSNNEEQSRSTTFSRNHDSTSLTTAYSDDSDSEDEEELYEESFRLETEHVNCECIKYRDSHDEFPYMKTLEDIQNKGSNMIQHHTVMEASKEPEENSEKTTFTRNRTGSFKRRGSLRRMSSRQRRITDSGRMPKSNSKDIDDGIGGDSDPKQVENMKLMKDNIEYMRVASQEDASILAKLYIRIPDKIHLCKIQTHLLLCAMRAFFTCNEGIQVRWVKSLHTKIYQLLQRSDTKIKFRSAGDDSEDLDQNNDIVCLLLSHDASVLLRNRQSSLLASVADILQMKLEDVFVLEVEKKMDPPEKKTKKSKCKKSSSSELEESGIFDVHTNWLLPVFL